MVIPTIYTIFVHMKNEIKKFLYKNNPTAILDYIKKGVLVYRARVSKETEDDIEVNEVVFSVPVDDLGDAEFLPVMDSKLLIRWLV